jgi:chromosome segregation ATPase
MTQRKVTLIMVVTSNQRFTTVEKQVEAITNEVAKTMGITNIKAAATTYPEPPKSRADRLQEASDLIDEGKTIAEDIKEELEEWRANLPENFQDKASEIDDAISSLEDGISNAESTVDSFSNVEMPGAFGS